MKLTKQSLLHFYREITSTIDYIEEELKATDGRILMCPPDKAEHILDVMSRAAILIEHISHDYSKT